MELQVVKKAGMYGLMVISQRDDRVCGPCLEHDGTVYTVEEAEKHPPLPHSACQNHECRCDYIPLPDKEAFEKAYERAA